MTPAQRRLRKLERRVHELRLTLRKVAQATAIAEKTHAPGHEVAALRQRRLMLREKHYRATRELAREREKL